ncbi:VCBS repeat-containing protein [Aliiroseovarius sp. 2305UL8-7]|uniref:VCBS repeat-containing protein n=1 Tax=Aliiroseovarius conchicola TaxID=3121637 RepID=UPI003529316B
MAAGMLAVPAFGEPIVGAEYASPTNRYAHGVLGDAIEWGALQLSLADGTYERFELPDHMVFEDLAPRLHDLDGDGSPEVITVLTHMDKGAALAIFGPDGLIAQTPHIGKRNRWLAPLGAGDLLGDGDQIVAYIDRPHLAKTLRLWRYKDGQLVTAGQFGGLTSHRIGDDFIVGGIRSCAGKDEVVTVDASWQNVMVTSFHSDEPTSRAVGRYTGRQSVDHALNCS